MFTREWRNWQTRTFEGRVDFPYGFKSRLSHQSECSFHVGGAWRMPTLFFFCCRKRGHHKLTFSDFIILHYTAVRIIRPCRKNSSVFLSGKYGIIPESRALSATKISLAVCPLSENALSNAPGLSVGRFFIFRIRPILFRFKTVPGRRRKPRDFALDMSKNICYTFTDRKNISRKTRFRKTAPKIICRNPMVPSGFSAESVRKIL